MVLEHARFTIDASDAEAFEAAFEQARAFVARAAGFRGLQMWRSVEEPGSYRRLIRWDSVEDHLVGFRESDLYVEWSALLRPFYAAAPVVDHLELVAEA